MSGADDKLDLREKSFLRFWELRKGNRRPGKKCETWSVNCQYLSGVHLDSASDLVQVHLTCLPRQTSQEGFLVYKKIILFDMGFPVQQSSAWLLGEAHCCGITDTAVDCSIF